MILIRDLAMNERKMRVPELEQAIWREVAETADRHDEPGRFTAFTGFEWTSMIEETTSIAWWSTAATRRRPRSCCRSRA